MRNRILACALLAAACAGSGPPVRPPLFPTAEAWTVELPEAVVGPLATDGTRIYAASRDGGVRAIDAASGTLAWGAGGMAGTVAADARLVVIRTGDGIVHALDAATGEPRWRSSSGIPGALPPVVTEEGILVGGDHGLARLDVATGRVVWSDSPRITAAPLWAAGVLVSAEDGAIRRRDPATGAVLWTTPANGPIGGTPALDAKGRVLSGLPDGRLVSVDARSGKVRWRWRIGAAAPFPPAAVGSRALFATHEAVLWSLAQGGGNLAWRAALPARPLSGPIVHPGGVLIAIAEDRIQGFNEETGKSLGTIRTKAEIVAPPLVVGEILVVALRNRTVVGVRLGVPLPSPSPEVSPDASPGPGVPSPGPAAPAAVPSLAPG